MKSKSSVKSIALIAMFCALSFVAVQLGKIIPNVAGFLSYDPKDAVIAIAGFLFGPVYAVVIPLVVSLVEMVTISETGPIGCLMNFLSTFSFALPAALLYRKIKDYKGAVLSLGCGIFVMTCCMLLWNWVVTPLYMKVDREIVEGMLLPVFLPFNVVKGGLNAALTLLLYKPLVTALRRARLIPPSEKQGEGKRFHPAFLLIAAGLLTVFTLLFLWIAGVIG